MPVHTKPIPAELPHPEQVEAADVLASYISGEIDLITVLGPTASGKTKYAVRLARQIAAMLPSEYTGVEIISADSRQIFRGMDIGTGKDLCEYGDIPYHLIDILPAGAHYNVFEFKRDFISAWNDIRSRRAIPILCGGTGLYINAVTAGYDFSGSHPLSATREDVPASTDGPRSTFFIGTLVSREVRNARIDARLDARLQEGMVEEIKGLLDSGVPAENLIAYGLEYKFVTQYVLGELDYDRMRLQLATAIHQFAKRQMTWFRGMERSGVRIHWVEV
ncbi:MAG: tRNA (adenosine(37)-N6)-dimethylallyltransferase MiaA [Bacteroidales bacterium]|nr:tRNA (adenosine(37)-N6)-dimethylallyltransferase MiaA [Bacteroidales bacterium]